jgi:hypothetical protein
LGGLVLQHFEESDTWQDVLSLFHGIIESRRVASSKVQGPSFVAVVDRCVKMFAKLYGTEEKRNGLIFLRLFVPRICLQNGPFPSTQNGPLPSTRLFESVMG